MIRNETNLGFAGANNQGAREAHGRILVLLNNDTEPITQWLAPMMRLLDDPGVGVVGAKLLYRRWHDSARRCAGALVAVQCIRTVSVPLSGSRAGQRARSK